jgi:hypothetical protein
MTLSILSTLVRFILLDFIENRDMKDEINLDMLKERLEVSGIIRQQAVESIYSYLLLSALSNEPGTTDLADIVPLLITQLFLPEDGGADHMNRVLACLYLLIDDARLVDLTPLPPILFDLVSGVCTTFFLTPRSRMEINQSYPSKRFS